MLYWSWTIAEIIVIIAVTNEPSSPLLSARVLDALVWKANPVVAASQINFNLLFLVGCLLVIAGGMIRLACYRELGSFFTFELSIRKDHKLITTGPYAYVRHPSYTGLVFAVFGSCLCYFGPGSWMRECSGVPLEGDMGCVLVTMLATSITWALAARTRKEDEMLRRGFHDWDDWAKRVPYRMIPYVF